MTEARGAARAGSKRGMQCMEIWGGNQAAAELASFSGLDVWVYSRPHQGAAAGGDIHYVSMCATGRIARLALADVSGHGASVDELAQTLRGLMRRSINTVDQARLARGLNASFSAATTDGRFATALLITYFSPSDHLIVCNAGHPRPLWYRAATNAWSLLDHQTPEGTERIGNLPLGVIDPTEYRQFAVRLGPGDIVVAYSDSLIEAAPAGGRALGEQGLAALAGQLVERAPDALGTALLERVRAHAGGLDPDDDVTLIVMHHNASDPPPLSIGEVVRVTARMLGLARV